MIALTERTQRRGRYADAPATVCLHHAGVAFPANQYGDHVARSRTLCLTRNDMRLTLLTGVEHVIARHGVDRHHWCHGIHAKICSGGRRVTRFIADVYRQSMIAFGQRFDVAGVQAE